MKLDRIDIDILRLAGKYRWLPYETLGGYGFDKLKDEIDLLARVGLVTIARNKKYVNLTPQGYDALHESGYDYKPGSKRAYADSTTLRRRLEAASIMLTALRAGIDVFPDDVTGLMNQPAFFPAFDLRDGDVNLMNAASCAGFGHWGDKGYMLQYVGTESAGMYATNELSHFHNLSHLFAHGIDTPLAMIFAGSSYCQIYEQLGKQTPSSRHGKHGFIDYWDAYRKIDMPIHLLSTDETGAMQLALMRQPDYNARLARAVCGDRWSPYNELIPEADGIVNGCHHLIIGVDMDIRRIARIISTARKIGAEHVLLVAFMSQIRPFLLRAFPRDDMIRHFAIEERLLDNAFGKDFSPRSMSSDT